MSLVTKKRKSALTTVRCALPRCRAHLSAALAALIAVPRPLPPSARVHPHCEGHPAALKASGSLEACAVK